MTTRCLKGTQQTRPTRTFYNPIGFNPAEVLPLHLHRYADYARYFLHVLYTQRIFKDIKDEFVPLKAEYLRQVLSRQHGLQASQRSPSGVGDDRL